MDRLMINTDLESEIAGNMALKDYLSSLRYASMIQHSLMPLPALMSSLFTDYFIYYEPKDYVSGDFYYVFRGKRFFCVAAGDCTGHGVPGALLSIMGIGFLNEILQCQPAPRANRVLNRMREMIMNALHQTGSNDEARDSIDMGLCIFSYDSYEMQFSGANSSLFIVSKEGLRDIRPDKMPLGLAPLKEEPFTNNIIKFEPGEVFYLFSDGYPDQFGGPKNKKFKYRPFRTLLCDTAHQSAKKQKDEIDTVFKEWKGAQPQIDDVMVFGFKPKIEK